MYMHNMCIHNYTHTHTAYPQQLVLPIPTTVMIKKGEEAVLEPLVSPGMLLGQYFIDWMNGSNTEALATIQGPRLSPTLLRSVDSRYSVDPNTFALTIRQVSFSDRGLYLGVVGVADPKGQLFFYTQTQSMGINLEVYGETDNHCIVYSIINSQ